MQNASGRQGEDVELKYITRGMSDPKGKPRVFFSCHPADMEMALPLISEDLLSCANCAVWYDPDMTASPGKQEMEEILNEMQLAVFAVSSRFLHEENRAKDCELPVSLSKHVPVLPIMLENGLENEFSNICAKIQVVSKYGTDPTATPYMDVLKTFLDSVLVGDELADKVRAAFDAYVFLSYRKKDRKHAQRLMRLIHDNQQFRDIAIWYDEFLVPGEGFNEAIRDAFEKSSLFAMTVTPHLEEKDNYVMCVEYPMARDRKAGGGDFEIVSVEMYGPEDAVDGKDWRIDQARLKEHEEFKYREISDLRNEHRRAELNETFLDALSRIAKKENEATSQHRYFIGLAYLNGIDMEVDHDRALELITGAAEDTDPYPEAAAKLADMYRNGEGVEADPAKAVYWQETLSAQYLKAYESNHDPEDHRGYGTAYFRALRKLSELNREAGRMREAIDTAEKALAFSDVLDEEVGIREQERDKALMLNNLGRLLREKGDPEAAEDCYRKACGIYEKQVKEIGTQRARRDLSICQERLGDICRKRGDLTGADTYYSRAKEIRERLNEDSVSARSRRDLSSVLTKLGDVRKAEKRYTDAARCYTMALEMDRALAEELRTAQSQDDYGVSLVKCGDIHKAEGRYEDAADCYTKARGIFKKLAEETASQSFRAHYAGGCEKLAGVEKKLDKSSLAESLYMEAVAERKKLYHMTKTVPNAHALATSCFNAAVFLKDHDLMREAYDLWRGLSDTHPEFGRYRDRAKL